MEEEKEREKKEKMIMKMARSYSFEETREAVQANPHHLHTYYYYYYYYYAPHDSAKVAHVRRSHPAACPRQLVHVTLTTTTKMFGKIGDKKMRRKNETTLRARVRSERQTGSATVLFFETHNTHRHKMLKRG